MELWAKPLHLFQHPLRKVQVSRPSLSISSLLVANRGEIAVRVIRTAADLGLRTIAVYSELDRDALHVELADEAWNIGRPAASESYLNGTRLIEVARKAGADAVHPGYGFLAENAGFARMVQDAGMVWVGPPASAIELMGDKILSRQAARSAGVEPVPGTTEAIETFKEAAPIASKIGYPIAVKAAHGGGGKGLRIAANRKELSEAIEGARREAEAYFGNPVVYLESYLDRARHIEAQILVDQHGNARFLGERDCSVQRRHQKLIEEAPSTLFSPDQRAALGEAALAIAESCGYVNAGTVEFLVRPDGTFYFLEMNTRLQVEHTVTEMVTGLDLVTEQLAIADGHPLSFDQVEVVGHALELRINAEDPAANFRPSPGTVTEYREPGGPGVRVDSWITPGTSISQFYDNLLAKLVVWGRTREEAIARAKRALNEYRVAGIATTIPAHRAVLSHPVFIRGEAHTRFVEQELMLDPEPFDRGHAQATEEPGPGQEMTLEVDGRKFDVIFWPPSVSTPTKDRPTRRPPRRGAARGPIASEPGIVLSPMQGTIVKVSAQAGDRVEVDQQLCVLEAMKMENEIRSPINGELVELKVQPGDTVRTNEVIAIVR
ncbi:MAG: acetyl-CoA carboxylase biotin carboxylase subunit [Acidimicrobiia bacterium]|nr:acetyl-CoA carboxylase biotin carboxylase subunit [Acidimicrobiia bacterium]